MGPGSCSVQERSSLGSFGKSTWSSWRLRPHGPTGVEDSSPTEQGAMPALVGAHRHNVPLLFCVPTSRSSVPCRFGLSTETRSRHRKLCFFIAAHFFVSRPSAITARHTISQRCLATNPGINFPFLRTPSTIRAASRCRVRFPVTGVGNCPFFGNDLLNIDDGPVSRAGDLCGQRVLRHRAVAHIVHVEVAFSSSAEATTAFPSATSNTCAVRTQHWRLGSGVMRQNRWWQPSDTTKQQFRHL